MSCKIKIEKDKPFPPEGYEEEHVKELEKALKSSPKQVLWFQSMKAKVSRIKDPLARAAKASGLMWDSALR